MIKKISVALLSLGLILMGPQPSQAETILEKAARTGQITLGVSLNQVPFSYVNDKDELVGYSLEIAELIRQQVATVLGKDIQLLRVEAPDVTVSIPKLLSGEIDIACDTAFTWERDRYVDFTISYAVTGMQLLLPHTANVQGLEDLAGKKIAIIPNTVIEKTVKLAQPKAVLVPFDNLQAGVLALKAGQVDGVAGDGVLLSGLRLTEGLDKKTKVVPDRPYMSYGIGCMMAQNNPAFLRLANQAIVKLAEGYVFGDPEAVALVNRWLGPEGVVKVDQERLRTFFNYILLTHEQVPLTRSATSR